MRLFWAMIVAIWGVHAAQATPVPPPPDGYAGGQYIDAVGCVFVAAGAEWQASLDGDGQPRCGFPPTLSARRTDPDTIGVLPDPQPASRQAPSEQLAETLAQGLRQGEFTADPRTPDARPVAADPAPPTAFQTQLAAMAAQATQLRHVMAPASDPGLCARLGYRPTTTGTSDGQGHGLGVDVTMGQCPGMTVIAPIRRIAAIPATADAAGSDTEQGGAVASAAPQSQPLGHSADPRAAKTAIATSRTTGHTTARRSAQRPAPPVQMPKPDSVEMIAASARYVVIGTWRDADNRMAAVRRLGTMGYPAAQSAPAQPDGAGRTVMAGPFRDRQTLIAALSRLRRAGYPQAQAR